MTPSDIRAEIDTALAKPPNGRRAIRADLEARYKWIRPEATDTVRYAKLGSRKRRRQPLKPGGARRIGKEFRPVYGHAIPAPDHKHLIHAMKVIDRRTARNYNESR